MSYPPHIKPHPYYSTPEVSRIVGLVKKAKSEGKKIVIASGVFDLLHAGHREYLQRAKNQGDFLVVLMESDFRTRELKGEGRPIWDQIKRKQAVEDLGIADEVLILPDDFNSPMRYEEIVFLLQPDVYAESSHSTALAEKEKLMRRYGGELRVVLKEVEGVSTTALLGSKK